MTKFETDLFLNFILCVLEMIDVEIVDVVRSVRSVRSADVLALFDAGIQGVAVDCTTGPLIIVDVPL